MTDVNPGRAGMTAPEVALLGEKEALQRLELLTTVSSLLDAATEDYEEALDSVAAACVTDFADVCVIETIAADGRIRVSAYRSTATHGMSLPESWTPLGRVVSPERRPVLVFDSIIPDEHAGTPDQHAGPHPTGATTTTRQVMGRLGAQSLLAVPITSSGVTLGWLVALMGPNRRGFRPSALRIATDLAGRIGTAMHSLMIRREMQATAREQTRTVRRLRRLAAAATNLAGAATTQTVLDTACLEACAIHEARGAMAQWLKADGSAVRGAAGTVDEVAAERAFEAVTRGRVSRGPGWIAYPLPNSDPWQHGALVVFLSDDMTSDDEPVLSSLASLIPVAFERALGTETALKHEARLRAVVDSSPVALIEVDPAGGVGSANRRAQELFGWPPNPGGWLLPDALRAEVVALCAEVVETGQLVSRSAAVEGRELSLSGAALPPVSSAAPSVLVAGVDLTDVRRAERALIQAQRLDAMGQVAGRVAHDFNNLLTLIIGYASILRRGMEDQRQLEMVANIESASKRAATLTQQMLDMTRQRVDTGVVTDLGAAVTGLDAVLARVAGPQVDLRIRASRNIIKVRLDPSETEQIVVNLVINACDAMASQGRIDVGVQVAAPPPSEVQRLDLPAGPLALLTVADDGPGMPPEVLARCLEPFFTTKERGRGTGLGLPTVYGLVRERGGQLHIESTVGEGTSIRIWLPIERDAVVTGGGGEDDESWDPGRRITGRVALVEDEHDLRAMALDALTSIGLEVEAFSNAEDALERISSGDDRPPFDALVTDVILPHMSGIDLVKVLRGKGRSLPVVYMTGYTGPRDIASDQGDPVVRKPYTPDQLRLRTAEVVALGRVRARSGTRRPGRS